MVRTVLFAMGSNFGDLVKRPVFIISWATARRCSNCC